MPNVVVAIAALLVVVIAIWRHAGQVAGGGVDRVAVRVSSQHVQAVRIPLGQRHLQRVEIRSRPIAEIVEESKPGETRTAVAKATDRRNRAVCH